MSHQPPPDAIAAAQAAQAKWHVPASVQLAQWALESGWGAHMPEGSNNPFGIKALPGQASVTVPTHEYVHGEMIVVQAAFRAFPSLSEAFDAHAQLLATRPQYVPAMACLPNVWGFCAALTGVYATDPHYGDLLREIITGSSLTRYDG